MLQVEKPKRGGMVIGPPHNADGTPGGGVRLPVQGTGKVIEEEGFEINIPHEIRDMKGPYRFKGKNIAILDKILKLGGYSIIDKVQAVQPRDVVICVRSAWKDEEASYTGTVEEILHQINTSNGCKPILKTGSNASETAKNGGAIPKGVKPREKDWQALDPNSPRWKKKKESLQELSNNIHRLRLNISRDMQSDDERTALTALVIGIMDRTAERIGNDDSADNGHFGVTGFRKKHITVVGNKVHLEYVGKSGTKHDKSISDVRISKALKKAIRNAPGKFIFETSDGFRVKCDKVNRYLEPFNISAKDIRGYNANRWIIELLKKADGKWQLVDEKKQQKERKKIFNKAVKETAARVGHGSGTLKKHYMVPELPVEYIQHGRIIDMKNIGYFKEGSEVAPYLAPAIEEAALELFKEGGIIPMIKISKVVNSDEGFDILDSDKELNGSTWSAGGCYVLAKAIQKAYGGELKAIENADGIMQHVLVKIGDNYIDSDGVASEQRKLKTQAEQESVDSPRMVDFDIKNLGVIPRGNPKTVNKLVSLFTSKMDDGGSVSDAEAMAKKLIDTLSASDIQVLKQEMLEVVNAAIVKEATKLNDLKKKRDDLKVEDDKLFQKEKDLPYGDEKSSITTRRRKIWQERSDLKPEIRNQENIVKAISNGGDLAYFTDKKGLEHKNIPDFSNIKTEIIAFNEETILTDAVPEYIPVIDEEVFSGKGFVFDALRIGRDKYLVAINGYEEKIETDYRSTSTVVGHPSDAQQGYIIVTLDQLALINDYYFTKARALAQKHADERSASNEKYYDKLPKEVRERHLNQKGFYHTLPVKVKKTITQEAYEALSLEEKEKLYKPFKRHGAKRLTSKLDDTHMWSSYHSMYERFINALAVPPKPRYANQEVFDYWRNFRDMMKWKIKDIQVQRIVESEVRKIALETSFGESNTDTTLKEKYGILVKRQNGTPISPAEIEQIRTGWEMLNKTFGTMAGNARKDNLKISHTGIKYVFASKAAGMYIPGMKTIAVSNKFGLEQFNQIFGHETAHWIDHAMGTLSGKRHATDDFESTAGIIARTFRKNMNAMSDSDYINSTAECFARAMEQYFAFENYGEDAQLWYSYGELQQVITYHADENYASKQVFNEKIKPLIKQFLMENAEWFKFGIEPAQIDTEEIKIKKTKKRMIQDSDHQPELFEEGGSIGMPEGKLTAEKVKEFFEGTLPSKIPAEKKKLNLNEITDSSFNFPFKKLDIKPIPFKVNKMDEPLKNAVGTDDLRPAMMGIFYDPEHKQKVATNAHVLVVIKDESITTKKLVDPNTGKEIDAKYPNYMSVIPENNPTKINLTEDQVDNLLNELNGIARAKRFLQFRSEGKLEARIKQQDLEVFVNPALLMTVIKTLKQYGATGLRIELSTPNRAIMVLDSRNNGNKGLVMPVMYKDDFIYADVLQKAPAMSVPDPKPAAVPVVSKPAKEETPAAPKKDRKPRTNIHSCAVILGRKGGLASAKARKKMDWGGEIEDTDPHDGSDVSPDSTEYLIDMELKPLIDKVRNKAIVPEYRSKISDADILGLIVSKYNRWDGDKIKVTCVSAFEDANYHDAAKQVSQFEDGGGIDEPKKNCGCFHSFLSKENPELVDRLVNEDVNSNSGLRAEVDQAYASWNSKK